jgi:chorismate mutase-like protein
MTEREPAVRLDASAILAPLRDRLDEVDRQILGLICQRMGICLDIARLKAQHDIPMMQLSRVGIVVGRARAYAAAHGMPEGYLGDIFERIVAETCRHEEVLIAELSEEAGSRRSY